MNYVSLKNNIIDTILEGQIKVGYIKSELTLYYPLESLNNLLGTSLDILQMSKALIAFDKWMDENLGKVTSKYDRGRFCIQVSASVNEYVYNNIKPSDFLLEFIEYMGQHHKSIEGVLLIFNKYSDKVCCEKIVDDDFDYVIYFSDGKVDNYRYCISIDNDHMTYHRFTELDYRQLIEK